MTDHDKLDAWVDAHFEEEVAFLQDLVRVPTDTPPGDNAPHAEAAAAPSHPQWQARWERAVESLGVPLHRMPSGAGHDAMKLHEIMPQAMLFVRGINAGISHNPLEGVTAHDAELAVRAFMHLVDHLQ